MLKVSKKLKLSNPVQAGLAVILEVLRGAAFVQVDEQGVRELEGGTGVEIPLRWTGGQTVLVVVVRRSGQPASARDALAVIENAVRERTRVAGLAREPKGVVGTSVTGVLVAPYISERVAMMCRKRGVGAADLAGNVWLSFGNVSIERSGRPNTLNETRELRSVFALKASRIVRLLLETGRVGWQVQALASEAGVSIGLVSAVKRALAGMDWLSETGGVALRSPEVVLRAWAASAPRFDLERLECFTAEGPDAVRARIAAYAAERKIDYAVCGPAAAWRWAPMVEPLRLGVYVCDDLATVAAAMDLKPVSSGGNVMLVRPRDAGVLQKAEVREGVVVTGAVQTYLDCVAAPGRGQEAAEAIVEQILRAKW